MQALKSLLLMLLCATVIACTPSYVQQSSKEFAARSRLSDSIDVQRGNERLLSRQAQLCLISDTTHTEAGLDLLRTMQAALGGYFVAVGVENESMDYIRALASTSCPGAAYLFYVQPLTLGCKDASANCELSNNAQFVITIINGGDRTLMDRIKLTIKKGVLPFNKDSEPLQKAFEQLAVELTGAH
jgi:hypothetical protein